MRRRVEHLRGLGKLAVEATKGVTELVQEMQGAIGGAPARILTAPVYASIKGVTSVIGGALDLALGQASSLLEESSNPAETGVVLAALNGVLGDYLADTKSSLAIEMRAHPVDRAKATSKVLLFVHGSSMNHASWKGARELGYTPLFVDYNSGLHISTNGRRLAALLDEIVSGWPLPVEEIAIIAHSMGGLVTRSACHYAEERPHLWRAKLRAIVFIGTPHHGAMLERGGNWIETILGVTRYSAPFARLAKIRSAGVTDLRFGNVIDDHWKGTDRFALETDVRSPVPLPNDVACYAVAAEKDALVPFASAMGEHANSELNLGFPADRRFIAKGMGHVGVLSDESVWEQVERWLR